MVGNGQRPAIAGKDKGHRGVGYERVARAVDRGGQPGRYPGRRRPAATCIGVASISAPSGRSRSARGKPRSRRRWPSATGIRRTSWGPVAADRGRRHQIPRRGAGRASPERVGAHGRLRFAGHNRRTRVLVGGSTWRVARGVADRAGLGAQRCCCGGGLGCGGRTGSAAAHTGIPGQRRGGAVRFRRRRHQRNAGPSWFESSADRPDLPVPGVLRRRDRPTHLESYPDGHPRYRQRRGFRYGDQHGVGHASARRVPVRQRTLVGGAGGHHRNGRGGAAGCRYQVFPQRV